MSSSWSVAAIFNKHSSVGLYMDNVENGQLKDEPLSLMYMIPLSPYAGCSKSPGQGLRGSSTRPQVIATIIG